MRGSGRHNEEGWWEREEKEGGWIEGASVYGTLRYFVDCLESPAHRPIRAELPCRQRQHV